MTSSSEQAMVIAGILDDRVTVSLHEGIADVRLNRADKRNALDNSMFASLAAAGEHLKTVRGLRAVVLSGVGPSFCAGLDFSSFQTMAEGRTRDGTMNASAITESGLTHTAQ
jgi:enoyl-CoA hydratase/carnithine racemase